MSIQTFASLERLIEKWVESANECDPGDADCFGGSQDEYDSASARSEAIAECASELSSLVKSLKGGAS